eukprot:5311007-Karenia_brevis.AAC.1
MAVSGGPPCETFGAAGGLALENGRSGPRALRSLGDIWGLKDLSAREGTQADLSNIRLMHVARTT